MDVITRQLLLCLITAHVLGDFLLQSDADVARKDRWLGLARHGLVITALSYVITGLWSNWTLPLGVLASHVIIDGVKTRASVGERPKFQGPMVFLVDQAVHVAALGGIAWWCARGDASPFWIDWGGQRLAQTLVVVSGIIVTVYACGYLIGLAIQPFLDKIEAQRDGASRGFTDGGSWIGRLERALIFLFVLLGQAAGVGFLIAAKSVFRFGEVKEHEHRMEAEYIIIGTLMSFGCGILCAYVTKVLLGIAWI